MTPTIRPFSSLRPLLGALCLGASALAWSQTTPAQLAQLLQQRQYEKVLTEVDQAMRQSPDRVDLTFYRAVALTELNRDDEALTAFRALSQAYPNAPEPLNNIGVLLARQGQYPAALDALKSALKADAQYAAAHENLGDVYARLSAQAYQSALAAPQGQSGNVTPKLQLVSQIAPLSPASSASAKAPNPQPLRAKAAPAAPVTTATPTAQSTASTAETSESESASVPAPAAPLTPEQQQVQAAVERWAKAWSQRDVAAYVASYTSTYAPPGQERQQWLAQRQSRIEGKSAIRVTAHDIKVNVLGNKATVTFTQKYAANDHRSLDRKVLVWVRQGDDWRIEQERNR